MKLVWGSVVSIETSNEGTQKLIVSTSESTSFRTAISYPAITGVCGVGDRVLVNRTASELRLGTGGFDFVVARDGEGVVLDTPAPHGGHIMKLRYTPLQVDVLSLESQESPHHDTLAEATSVESMPVVCCSLHSQLPLVAAAIKTMRPDARIAYCMTDEAALPLPLSQVISELKNTQLLDATISCGQAFGGDYESINLHSGLLVAKYVAKADITIVAVGPGIAGTATPFGHGGIAVGEAVNAAAAVEGCPVVALRTSFADARERHRGVSHHSIVALSKIALSPAVVPLAAISDDADGAKIGRIQDELAAAGIGATEATAEAKAVAAHEVCMVELPSDEPGRGIDMREIQVKTMGRAYEDDPTFFETSFAAGVAAAELLSV